MRKTREILRLHFEALYSPRQIASSAGVALSTVQSCLHRAHAAAVPWPLPGGWDETRLEQALYPPRSAVAPNPLPDFVQIEHELRRKGVTLLLLWQEFKAIHPQAVQYSQFCAHFARWRSTQDAVLRQSHAPGDKVFVDYAGTTLDVVDRHTGALRKAQVFIAVMGASNFTYAEATWTQTLPDWLASQRRALEFFGGVPHALVPDNLKSAVTKAQRYEPDLNPAYQEFAEHYGVSILPARVRKPRDKAKAEVGVQVVERWIVARLRHLQCFSLLELNDQIRGLLQELNTRRFKKRDGNRASLFAELDQPALQPLPVHGYEFGLWKRAKVHLDYHIESGHHYYSVPHRFIGARVDVRLSAHSVEIFHKGQRVATHALSERRGGFSTIPEHRPAHHQAMVDLNHERLLTQAASIGPSVVAVLRAQAVRRGHPEQAIRSGLGVLRLAKDFSPAALESACARALQIHSYSYRSIHQLMLIPPQPTPAQQPVVTHENLRGAPYYQESILC